MPSTGGMTASSRTERGSRQPATVAELMRRHFISLAPEDSLLEAFQLMRLARLRLVPVVREGVLVGVLGYRDLNQAMLRELLGNPAPALEALLVENVMDAPAVTIAPEARLVDAATSLCRSSQGCLPVVEPGQRGPRLLGLVTESDLLRVAFGPDARPA
jgi:acetoin utilization protein AcuB